MKRVNPLFVCAAMKSNRPVWQNALYSSETRVLSKRRASEISAQSSTPPHVLR